MGIWENAGGSLNAFLAGYEFFFSPVATAGMPQRILYANLLEKVALQSSRLRPLRHHLREAFRLDNATAGDRAAAFREIVENPLLLCLESIALNFIGTGAISTKELRPYSFLLRDMTTEELALMRLCVSCLFTGTHSEATVMQKMKGLEGSRAYRAFLYMCRLLRPRFDVTVCATMSSGKSTFISAFLGRDLIPSSQEACTARVLTLDSCPTSSGRLAFARTKAGKTIASSDITRDEIAKWNAATEVERIVLDARVEATGTRMAIHDTPGTNFSGDAHHSAITLDFLRQQRTDLLVFIVNAEQIATEDSDRLLRFIRDEVVKKRHVPVIFPLNKLDSFDEEADDNIRQSIARLRNQLRVVGFPSPIVFPLAAEAAKLFRMAAGGTAFTRKEMGKFRNYYDFFMKRGTDFSAKRMNGLNYEKMSDREKKTGMVTVGRMSYSAQDLAEAVERTGINVIAKHLDREASRVNNKTWIEFFDTVCKGDKNL